MLRLPEVMCIQNMIITHYKKTDFESLNNFRAIMNKDKSQPHRLSPLVKDDFLNTLEWIAYVAKINNVIIGHLSFSPEHNNSPKNELCLNVFIHPEHRGQGIGTKMFNRVSTKLKKFNEIDRITLTVKKENKQAIKLYKKWSFTENGSTEQAMSYAINWMLSQKI
jgi:RimJ/RimL family protein N-acetyltransferase